MIPIYGFLEGDTLGVLVFAQEEDTVQDVIKKLKSAASSRINCSNENHLFIYKDKFFDPSTKLNQIEIKALDRFDLVRGKS